MEQLVDILQPDPRIAYAVLFGSAARGTTHAGSDLDVAVGLVEGARLEHRDLGALASRLESAAGRPVDLVLVGEAPCSLAYRVFRDGHLLFERDHAVLVADRVRAVLEYLDFKPFETLVARGVLRAAAGGR